MKTIRIDDETYELIADLGWLTKYAALLMKDLANGGGNPATMSVAADRIKELADKVHARKHLLPTE